MRIAKHLASLLVLLMTAYGWTQDWPCVGNDRGCMRFSPLTQINRQNVSGLHVAWTYHTCEGDRTIECTPVVVDGVMYITTNHLRAVALNAATGEQIWSLDPFATGPSPGPLASGGVNRGVAYWSDGKPNGQRRILHGISDGRLFSIDARTGQLDPEFGQGGVKDLREDLDRDISKMPYGPTSAPAIWQDTVVLGFSNGEGPGPAAPGDVRAFDVHTGKQLWRFHTVPRPGEIGNETWKGDSWVNRGGANAWGGLSIDEKRGWVFCGLGSAAFDFYGGDRQGENLFANCTIALDARNGQRIWHFQTTHHDLWDHDLPTYPNLVTVRKDGVEVEAVAQVTKTGFVFLFDRETGTPLFDVKEVPAAASDTPGESAWPTQPVPVKPPPIARQIISANDITDVSAASHEAAMQQLAGLRYGQRFMPPSLQGTLVTPGFHGGATWAGASFDPSTGYLFVNSNNVPNVVALQKMSSDDPLSYTHKGYNRFLDREGYPAIKPPWGLLTAIDLSRGEFVWQVPLGEYPELTVRGIPQTGTENFGGTIVTAGGLVFIGGSKDEMFHAFDSSNGKLLWQVKLPAGGYATPCAYAVNGKQFIVIAAGGAGKPGTPSRRRFCRVRLVKRVKKGISPIIVGWPGLD